ncbi:MAG: metal-dependent hydrolase [Myxococcota bacterium]
MNPIIHAELSWLTAQPLATRRDRLLVTLAGLAPDLDGLTLLAGEDAYGRWHHVLTHGIVAAVAVTAGCAAFAVERRRVAALAFGAFHLHLLCDLAGSGPGWPLYYLWPFSRVEWMWDGQWDLASWQNTTIGLAVTLAVLGCAVWFGRTVVELVSLKADAAVVAAVRRRVKRPADVAEGSKRD